MCACKRSLIEMHTSKNSERDKMGQQPANEQALTTLSWTLSKF